VGETAQRAVPGIFASIGLSHGSSVSRDPSPDPFPLERRGP
jgi:hypothetical protein